MLRVSRWRVDHKFGSRAQGDLYLYSRHENPSQEAAAELVRDLEGGEAARVFASGMGAIATTVLSLVHPGDEVVALESLYGGTVDLFAEMLPRFGVRVRWVGTEEAADPDRCVGPETKLVFLESPTNPTLRVIDLARWSAAADRVGAISIVDNTMATPILQRPIDLGIDLVVHSATKYLGGHADLLAGVVVGPAALLERVRSTHLMIGSVLDPLAAFLLVRGMKTLPLRIARQSESAAQLAARLAGHPRVERVLYPGRASAEEEAIAARQMRGRGGMVSFVLRGGLEPARRFLRGLSLVQVASSFGGVESLASLPEETSHVRLAPEERIRRGIEPGMVRLSVGTEELADLERDLTGALDRLQDSKPL
jgi:cystathionine beta-lyase/cystathionine gamma-synthase